MPASPGETTTNDQVRRILVGRTVSTEALNPRSVRNLPRLPPLLAPMYSGRRPDRMLGMRGRRITSQGTISGRSAAGAFDVADPASLLLAPEEVADPVLRILLDRARSGSRPIERSDPHTVCLAIEGGGMRGAVSAGMGVVLEAAGLVPAVDRIYGVSAGALNGWAIAAGQAALGATHYRDAVSYGVINRMRPLVRRPVIDFDLLFEELIASRKPLSFDRLRGGPEFRALATSLDCYSLRVLADFSDLVVDSQWLGDREHHPRDQVGERLTHREPDDRRDDHAGCQHTRGQLVQASELGQREQHAEQSDAQRDQPPDEAHARVDCGIQIGAGCPMRDGSVREHRERERQH